MLFIITNINLMYNTRNCNKLAINEANWMAIGWISRVEQYLLKYGKMDEIDWINAKIHLNWINIHKIEKIIWKKILFIGHLCE